MPGQIKLMIDEIIEQRAKGDPLLERTTRTKLLLKGINPSRYSADTPDDELVMEKLIHLGKEMGCSLSHFENVEEAY